MYLPEHFQQPDAARVFDLIRANPLGLLICAGPDGVVANAAPFILDAADGATVLRTHIARANGQWRALATADEALVVFQGPDAYVTPGWYATKAETGKVVPTWNYAMAQVRGRPRVVEDAAWLRAQVDAVTTMMEGGRPAPWSVDDAPPPFVASQLRGIVGVELPITQIEGKWKVSQNRSDADRSGVARGLRAERGPEDPMARLVDGR